MEAGERFALGDDNAVIAAGIKQFIAEHDWLTVVQLPPYAPQLNPVAFTDPDHLMAAVRCQLRAIQHRPRLIDGALAETGLELTPILAATSALKLSTY